MNISNPDFKIYQNNNAFTIELAASNEPLLKSIVRTKQLIGATVMEDYKSICFRASTVQTYTQYFKNLDYSSTLKMISSLSLQLENLIKIHQKCFYLFSPDNLIVVNGDKFVYLSNEHLVDIVNDNIVFTRPFTKTGGFTSPEIMRVDTIPTEIDLKTVYYGLGSLAAYCLLNIQMHSGDDDIKKLDSIQFSKLYWFLTRCFNVDQTKRCLLYV